MSLLLGEGRGEGTTILLALPTRKRRERIGKRRTMNRTEVFMSCFDVCCLLFGVAVGGLLLGLFLGFLTYDDVMMMYDCLFSDGSFPYRNHLKKNTQ